MKPELRVESTAPAKRTSPAWSLADPLWWICAIAAVVAADVARRTLPGEQTDLTHYALGAPLVGLLASTAYVRLRLRATWIRAAAIGLGMAALLFAIGWVKGWL